MDYWLFKNIIIMFGTIFKWLLTKYIMPFIIPYLFQYCDLVDSTYRNNIMFMY